MQPRYGRGLAASVLRPLAEQLLAGLHVEPGSTVCELMSDSGHLSQLLARAIGAGGTLILTETDPALLQGCVEQVGGLCTVAGRLTDGRTLGVEGNTCDRVASLATLGGTDATALLRETRRVLRADGRAGCIVWDAGAPPPYEHALATALHAEAGVESPFLRGLLAMVGKPEDFSEIELRDVARFDSFSQLWVAIVDERPLAAELRSLSLEQCAAVRQRCADLVASYVTADGALRIPVAARLLQTPGS